LSEQPDIFIIFAGSLFDSQWEKPIIARSVTGGISTDSLFIMIKHLKRYGMSE
jgi:hypothetical protein